MEQSRERKNTIGGLAQLARALDLHSRGQGFDSLILHRLLSIRGKFIDMLGKTKLERDAK